MIIKLKYSKKAKKFLSKNSSSITEKQIEQFAILSIKKLIMLEDVNINLIALKGKLKGFYRIRTGNIRIIFNLQNDKETTDVFIVFFANDIDYRGNVYE